MKKIGIAAIAISAALLSINASTAFAQASGAMSNNAMSQDSMHKDTMGKDAMSHDTMGKSDAMKHDSMSKPVKGDAMVPVIVIVKLEGAGAWPSTVANAVSVPLESMPTVTPGLAVGCGFKSSSGSASVTLMLTASAVPRFVTVIV